jgi:hypothetical protein
MSDERPTQCPSCGCNDCLSRDFSGINAVVDSNQPKTIGDLANKNTEDAVKRGELPKSALDWESNRKKKREVKNKAKKISEMTQQQKTDYIMTGKMP